MVKVANLLGLFGLLALSPAASSQAPPGAVKMSAPSSSDLAAPLKFVFPGGVTLRVKNDEMTDQRVCTISTPLHGIYLEFYGKAGASIWTSDAIGLDYSIKPIMRLGEGEPFELDTARRPHPMFVPSDRTADLVRALYSGAKIRVRFTQWPSGDTRTMEIEQGDFASAYDRGAEFCAWPKPSAARAVLSHEPNVTSGGDGSIHAKFGGSFQWLVDYSPRLQICDVRAPLPGPSFTFWEGKLSPSNFGRVFKIYKSSGELVGIIEQPDRAAAPIRAILEAAAAAGDGGMLEVDGGLYSLFGLSDAIPFAEKTCGVNIQ